MQKNTLPKNQLLEKVLKNVSICSFETSFHVYFFLLLIFVDSTACKKTKLNTIDIKSVKNNCVVDETATLKLESCQDKVNSRKSKEFRIILNKICPDDCKVHQKFDEVEVQTTKEHIKHGDKINLVADNHSGLRRTGRTQKVVEKYDPTKNIKPKTSKAVQIITPVQMSNIIWTELTTKCTDVEVGMVVCAKMATYWPWPAQIINMKNKNVRVKFFGDLREGNVQKFQCVPLINCHNLIYNYLRTIDEETRRSWYNDLIGSLDISSRGRVKHFPIRKLYLQAVKDVEIYFNSEVKLLNNF